jgi:hypothetical protein
LTASLPGVRRDTWSTQRAFLVAGLIGLAATVYGWADTGRASRRSTPPIAQVA